MTMMMFRIALLLALLFALSEAFAPHLALTTRTTSAVDTSLFSCRTNAKKEKIKRNRENMRKFKTTGKKGTSRRKTMKKALSTRARQSENEFISKCFITVPPPNEGDNN
uniref:50S ribosomal protein L35 n=1 Tax=Amphora coffeiformis TaxID=265554 RepID=A0A7S3P5K8_9STRA|mmetsp:Transcript_3836/g.7630  ORF Transcript_3836/g.7630 Transcript_3836/m.7630 type:complete len:109 (+) Transcript_3836:101-427(+)